MSLQPNVPVAGAEAAAAAVQAAATRGTVTLSRDSWWSRFSHSHLRVFHE